MRNLILVMLTLGLVLAVHAPTAAAAAEPKFYETVVVEDTADDYKANGALDIVAVHLSEKYQYDSDKQVGQETLTFRFQARALNEIQCTSVIRYDIFFKVDGADKHFYAGFSTLGPTDRNACALIAKDGSGTVAVRGAENSLLLIMTREAVGAPIGAVMTNFYATSMIVTEAQVVPHDVAPMDNQNLPSQTAPTSGLKSYTATGTYPFITVVSTDGTEKYSVGGAEVEYNFNFVTHPELKDENIRVRFTFPEGFTISPSQGRTGSDPEGQLTAANDGAPRPFSFTLASSGAVSEGDTVSVVMEVITDTGGHALVPTVTTISGEKIEDPSLNFTLVTPGPFKAGETSPVRFKVGNASGPLTGVVLSVDLIQGGRRVSTTPLTPSPDGSFQGLVRFPGEGTYTLDAYISSLRPSPHQGFVVKAEEGGFAPGVEVGVLLLSVGVLALLRRRD